MAFPTMLLAIKWNTHLLATRQESIYSRIKSNTLIGYPVALSFMKPDFLQECLSNSQITIT